MDHHIAPLMQQTRYANHSDYKSVQAWKKPKIIAPQLSQKLAQDQILHNLEKAAKGEIGTFDAELQTANAYANSSKSGLDSNSDSAFKFKDVIDIVNPLQHLPVVNVAYRRFTGDAIHPASQIIGGAIYGGPLGAIGGTVNAIVQIKTGRDIGDNALNFAGLERKPPPSSPEIDLTRAASRIGANQSLSSPPNSALSFANVNETNKAVAAYERIQMAEGRTAGSIQVRKNWISYAIDNVPFQPDIKNIDFLPPREEVTTIKLNKMPIDREI